MYSIRDHFGKNHQSQVKSDRQWHHQFKKSISISEILRNLVPQKNISILPPFLPKDHKNISVNCIFAMKYI